MSSDLVRRSKVMELEESLVDIDESWSWEDVTHHFSQGVYCREARGKADSVIVGKIHRYSCTNVLLEGRMIIESEFESGEYVAPAIWISPPGNKRAIYYKEDTRWMTIHPNPTNTQDLSELEGQLIADSYAALEAV